MSRLIARMGKLEKKQDTVQLSTPTLVTVLPPPASRWEQYSTFPRILDSLSKLQLGARQRDYTLYGQMYGVFETSSTDLSIKVGLIAQEWCDWLPAFAYIPMQPTWFWIIDPKWESIVK